MTTDDESQEGLDEGQSEQDDRVDEVEEESFPASDPPSTWAGQKRDFAD